MSLSIKSVLFSLQMIAIAVFLFLAMGSINNEFEGVVAPGLTSVVHQGRLNFTYLQQAARNYSQTALEHQLDSYADAFEQVEGGLQNALGVALRATSAFSFVMIAVVGVAALIIVVHLLFVRVKCGRVAYAANVP